MIVVTLLCGLFVFPVRATSTLYDWSKPRPSSYKSYNETVGNSQTNGIATVGLGVEIADYIPRSGSFDYDALRIRVTTSANTRVGIQYALVEEDPLYDWCDVLSRLILPVIMVEFGLTSDFFSSTTVLDTIKFGCAATAS